ncbi:hypothetical protein EfmJHP9_27850 [Enterococcus faecium]|nr:hypothetical protein EfmJHP9_27850 [Enterococcus faecium]
MLILYLQQGESHLKHLTKLIDFANASPRPVVIRYVLQLTKPLDEILEDMN